ncbi:Diaminopimelate decarboxylase, LysA [Syntrophomonas zehnderi OL-4]|uniref:Diaminopimelate decarboxylase n=1 Tax=Syntrophomonas zehnderi OL-4 TaxID=690567 RepID=A0A0E4C855_9FIRM|nr:diaminopimelate decarboxylase [Syntrophomonas zehnderi]CFX26408.1 Diaminopimelate decarboxylase, LysA [Syntrophomonas zehnderi OL-4]
MGYEKQAFAKADVLQLLKEYGSPLYVYDEEVLRNRCRELRTLVKYPHFRVNYSAKANTNVELLKIIKDEGLDVDAMSPGEMYLEMKAGFTADRIMFIGNNVSRDELQYAVDRNIYISVDSLSQLALLGEINRGGQVCLRINPIIGAGHHEKVVTGGKKAKFGIAIEDLPKAQKIADSYDMTITGLNQHIGSLFLETEAYVAAAAQLLDIAATLPTVQVVDFGGGMGIPYRHEEETRLDLHKLGQELDDLIATWVEKHWPIMVRIEPGRYVVAECGIILGTVTAVKNNYNTYFVGCDIGFNTLIRPAMYDSYHEISVVPAQNREYQEYEQPVYLVGPICESGDILAHDRVLPVCREGDGLIVHDAGAYGFAMASNYNSRPLPAEVLIQKDGKIRIIRKAQSLKDL